jgi:hypothetical protein
MKRVAGVVAVLVSSLVVACGDGSDGRGDMADELKGGASAKIGADGLPVGADGKPLPPKLGGTYELTTELDLTESGLLPDALNDTLGALTRFREEPTQTIVDLAKVANVPVVPGLVDVMPGLLKDKVLGFVDEHVFGAVYESQPVTKQVTSLLDDLSTVVTQVSVLSTLDMPEGDGIGDAQATHRITGIGYRWSNELHVINAPELVSKLSAKTTSTNAVLLEKRSPELETGRLKVGNHTFAIPVGAFAVAGADALARDRLGASDLRGALGKLVDCDKLADAVSNKCIAAPIGPKVCVGHRAELKTFCTKGLDLVASSVKSQLLKLDIPALSLVGGFAQMWDAPQKGGPLDATIDRIDNGFWDATIQIGKTPKEQIATFTGRRVGESSRPTK